MGRNWSKDLAGYGQSRVNLAYLDKAADLVLGTIETIEIFCSDDDWESVHVL